MIAILAAALLAANATPAPPSPFAPSPAPAAKILRMLGPEGGVDAATLEQFEHETGTPVAYDAYDDAQRFAAKWREGPYDLVLVAGPTLTGLIAANALRKLPRGKIANARLIAAPIAAKLAAYDAGGDYALAWGWSALGILYDGAKTVARLGGPPASWNAALAPESMRRLLDCGVALPDSRDELFVAAWRMLGLDPCKLREIDVKAAADALIRARGAASVFAAGDPVGAMASGAACLSLGGAAQARFATERSKLGGANLDIRYAAPREGGPIVIVAMATPADAPQPAEAATLVDFLLRPEVAARNARAAGLESAEAAPPAETARTLWPVGAVDARLARLIEKEWARVRGAK